VLRIVNSPLYPQVQEVNTVSRAIVVLGWNEVQRLALTLKLFDSFPGGANETEVKSRLARAFLAGILARNLSGSMNARDVEQSFICALFHSFGELLVATYMPEKEVEGRALAERHRLPPKSAIRIALGLTYSELGIAVAKQLRFPETLVDAMQKGMRVKVPKKPKGNELQIGLANLGYDLSNALLSEPTPGQPDRRCELEKLLKDFEEQFGSTNTKLSDLVERSLADLALQAKVMDLPIPSRKLEERAAMAMGARVVAAPASAAMVASEEIFNKGIAQTMRSLVEESSLSDVLLVVLDTIYIGLKDLGLRRVIFALRDPREPVLRFRSGKGLELGDAPRWFEIPLNGSKDLISQALADGKDRVLEQLCSGDSLPAKVASRAQPNSNFVLLPIVVADKPIGIFYLEGQGPDLLDRGRIGGVKTLRDQVVIAIARSSRAAA
jgi:eukaryotic-like serine/threonine-protein kinase